jgi:hypothetical protein
MAELRAWDCDCREFTADLDCDTLPCRFSVNVRDSVCKRASFSGFGGTGGGGPIGFIDGSSTSNGDVSKSGVSRFCGFGAVIAC